MSNTIFSLLDTPAYGGAEQYLLDVLIHLERSGYRVILATNNSRVKAFSPSQIEVVDLPYRLDAIGNWKGLLKYFFALPSSLFWLITTLKQLQKENPIVCLFPGYTDRLTFSPIVKWLGCRLIWLEYGPLESTFARNHGFPKILYAIGRPFPDIVVTISEWTKRSLMRLGEIPAEKIEIIYPGIVIPAKAGIQTKKKHTIVVTVARLAKEKEIDLLIQAWAIAHLAYARLQIIGDGPERNTLEQLVTRLGLGKSVSFFGFVSDKEKQRVLQRADLFVFPSAWSLEGFGMTTIEAMAAGIAVISTGYGPQSEIVRDGVTGWTFIPHDAVDLARVLRRVRKDPQRVKIGRHGQMSVKRSFSQRRSRAAWLRVVGSVQNERYR